MTRSSDNQNAVGDFVRNEVSANVNSLVMALAEGFGSVTFEHSSRDLEGLCEQAFELACPVPDYEEAAIQEGWNCSPGVDGEQVIWHGDKYSVEDAMFPTTPGKPTYSTWQECCEAEDIEPYDREVFEHWIVSSYLADKLEAHGEKVDRDFAGLIIWARTTTGQAILLDGVICDIFDELHSPKKQFALVPDERGKVCEHSLGFLPSGRMGAGGRILRCPQCGTETQEEG